ncbi:MAG: phosphoglucosamine mutase [Saprospiraceae bacterium]
MPLIKSVSGIRGVIGGKPGENLTPIDIVKYSAAFADYMMRQSGKKTILIGRDGRISGELVSQLVSATLQSMGANVIDLGLSTTPSVEMAVLEEAEAAGGIILTASHNPREWNALKLLNAHGEFLDADAGAEVLRIAESEAINFAPVDQLGSYIRRDDSIVRHIQKVLQHPLVLTELVQAKGFRVVVDPVNSTGALALPPLLEALGCHVTMINEEVNGQFAHNPEPLRMHLQQLSSAVKRFKADIGIAVDPDVDRLVLLNSDGDLFGEEYTLVAAADYVLSKRPGNTVSNLSSSRALADITEKYGGQYTAAAVGEVHVVRKMKETQAVVGGEGNGGVILPDLHYGRDALIGIALILSLLAERKISLHALRARYPNYEMIKSRFDLNEKLNLDAIFDHLKTKYRREKINTEDGLRIDFDNGWIHLRPSNTEPIIRLYAESKNETIAHNLTEKIIQDIRDMRVQM